MTKFVYRTRVFVILVSIMCLFSPSSRADQLSRAFSLLSEGKLKAAEQIFVLPENEHKIFVQYKLAEIYYRSLDGQPDLRASARLFRLVTENKNAISVAEVGAGYANLANGDLEVVRTFLKQVAGMRHSDILARIAADSINSAAEYCVWSGLAEKYSSSHRPSGRTALHCTAEIAACDRSYYTVC